jgi:hypothetical protein
MVDELATQVGRGRSFIAEIGVLETGPAAAIGTHSLGRSGQADGDGVVLLQTQITVRQQDDDQALGLGQRLVSLVHLHRKVVGRPGAEIRGLSVGGERCLAVVGDIDLPDITTFAQFLIGQQVLDHLTATLL